MELGYTFNTRSLGDWVVPIGGSTGEMVCLIILSRYPVSTWTQLHSHFLAWHMKSVTVHEEVIYGSQHAVQSQQALHIFT